MSTNGPSNGSNAPDPNTVTGWSVQGSAAHTSLDLGTPSAGHAQPGVAGAGATARFWARSRRRLSRLPERRFRTRAVWPRR
jgi:hypothetical protein